MGYTAPVLPPLPHLATLVPAWTSTFRLTSTAPLTSTAAAHEHARLPKDHL